MTFQKAATHYSGLYPKMPSDETRIRAFCNNAQNWVNSAVPVSAPMVNELVVRTSNGVSNADRGAIINFRSRLGLPALPKNAFRKLLDEMFKVAASSSTITEDQYLKWKEDKFFIEAEYRAEVVFNRLVFALFPNQFCSVSKPERLRKVGEQMCSDNLLPAGTLKLLSGLNWYRLCSVIVPAVKAGFPKRDFAYCSAFLAAIGVVVSK